MVSVPLYIFLSRVQLYEEMITYICVSMCMRFFSHPGDFCLNVTQHVAGRVDVCITCRNMLYDVSLDDFRQNSPGGENDYVYM